MYTFALTLKPELTWPVFFAHNDFAAADEISPHFPV
jgi:hypothetical protein